MTDRAILLSLRSGQSCELCRDIRNDLISDLTLRPRLERDQAHRFELVKSGMLIEAGQVLQHNRLRAFIRHQRLNRAVDIECSLRGRFGMRIGESGRSSPCEKQQRGEWSVFHRIFVLYLNRLRVLRARTCLQYETTRAKKRLFR